MSDFGSAEMFGLSPGDSGFDSFEQDFPSSDTPVADYRTADWEMGHPVSELDMHMAAFSDALDSGDSQRARESLHALVAAGLFYEIGEKAPRPIGEAQFREDNY